MKPSPKVDLRSKHYHFLRKGHELTEAAYGFGHIVQDHLYWYFTLPRCRNGSGHHTLSSHSLHLLDYTHTRRGGGAITGCLLVCAWLLCREAFQALRDTGSVKHAVCLQCTLCDKVVCDKLPLQVTFRLLYALFIACLPSSEMMRERDLVKLCLYFYTLGTSRSTTFIGCTG